MSNLSDFEDDVSEIEREFNEAAAYLQKNVDKMDQSTLLQLYGFYKQGTVGKCNIPKPGMFNLQGKAKWNAWNDLRDMTKDTAMSKYVEKLNEINPQWNEQNTKKSNEQWVAVSRHQIGEDDAEISDGDKTIFDHVKEGNVAKLEAMLSAKNTGKLNEIDNSGLGLVHWASDRGFVEILQVLLKNGADINLLDSDGQTALHYAASCGHLDCVKLLIKLGANRSIQDNELQTCVDVADGTSIADLLKS